MNREQRRKQRKQRKQAELAWVLTRGACRDVVGGVLPTLPNRFLLMTAWRAALGIEDVGVDVMQPVLNDDGQPVLDDDGQPVLEPSGQQVSEPQQVREADGDDLAAVAYAALGLCWAGPDLGVAMSLRQCKRDVIEYGEHVQTAMWDAGYQDARELMQAGRTALDAIEAATFGAVVASEEEEAGFGTAQGQP